VSDAPSFPAKGGIAPAIRIRRANALSVAEREECSIPTTHAQTAVRRRHAIDDWQTEHAAGCREMKPR